MFCSTKPSWQGGRCAPPLHPPSRGSFGALNPIQSQKIVSPINHSAGGLRSPCTHRLGGRSCPQDPRPCHGGHFMETNPARFGCPPSCRRWITPKGLSPPPNPARRTLRIASPPTPNHAQSTARLIPDQGELSCYPRYPYDHTCFRPSPLLGNGTSRVLSLCG